MLGRIIAQGIEMIQAGEADRMLNDRRWFPRRWSRLPFRFWAVGVLLVDGVLLLALLAWQLSNLTSVSVAVFDIDQSAGPDVGVTLREVATNPGVMYGRTVTISAEVNDQIGSHVMTIGSDTPIVGNEVLIASQVEWETLAEQSIDGDDVVRVTGEVALFDRSIVEQELGLDLDAAVYGQFQGDPVLLVDSLTLNPPFAIGPGDKEFPSGSSGWDLKVTVGDIRANPQAYMGQTILVSDEIDEGDFTTHTMVLGDTKLLVVSAAPLEDAFIEATAYVTGRLRRFNLAEIEAELGIDLRDEELAASEGDLVIVAESVEVIA